jgi:hypothetical protein
MICIAAMSLPDAKIADLQKGSRDIELYWKRWAVFEA